MLRDQTTLRTSQTYSGNHSAYNKAVREPDHGMSLSSHWLFPHRVASLVTETGEQYNHLSLRGKERLSCEPRAFLGGRRPRPGHCVTLVTVGPCGSHLAAVIGFPVSRCFSFRSTEARGVNWSRSSYSLGGKEGKPSYTTITRKMTQCVLTYPCCGIAHRHGLVSTGASRINKDQAQNRTLRQQNIPTGHASERSVPTEHINRV